MKLTDRKQFVQSINDCCNKTDEEIRVKLDTIEQSYIDVLNLKINNLDNITYLDFTKIEENYKSITKEQLRHLHCFLKSPRGLNISKLILSRHNLSNKGEILSAILKKNTSIKELKLDYANLTNKGLGLIIKSVRSSNLSRLNIVSNRITSDIFKFLSKIKFGSNLREINLRGNPIKNGSIMDLIRISRNNPHLIIKIESGFIKEPPCMLVQCRTNYEILTEPKY